MKPLEEQIQSKLNEAKTAQAISALSDSSITILTGLSDRNEIRAFKQAWMKFAKKKTGHDWSKSFKEFTKSKVNKITRQKALALAG